MNTIFIAEQHIEYVTAAPFFSDFHREEPYWSYPLPVKYVNNVPLPYGKTGHHVLLALWVVADTGMAFYQAIDLQFSNQAAGWNAPEYPLWDKFCTYYPNAIVRWGCGNYKACYISQGTEPGKRAPDGSYPWIPL
ncbi:lytic polysaccharide monooxygenase [Symbiopectobacterium sp.]|uniref:lytic polysaccharide monooxygenase n=1 Tax=Symbiopectobacterium sp. TaxID=2952789 RepID=UPI003F308533